MKSLIGYKIGMTQVFLEDGQAVPVTVVEVEPNVVLQNRTVEKDGYVALQVGITDVAEKGKNKPELGHFKKVGVTPKRIVKEIKGDELSAYKVGDEIRADLFKAGELVDVTGITKGKGFMGVVKTYGFRIGPQAHGSGFHRGVGSLATAGRTNNRIHPGRKMPGHHSHHQKTMLNLQVVAIDLEHNAILIKGAIPGPNKSLVTIRSAIKFTKNVKPISALVDYSAE
ncbi:MAG: 50S ribosomal protein L3 [Bacillales bacterium]|jgi:large subunit ribosomal protein L3|nr:50S ribosomal protein L3 [Bacillales bacterium]